MLADGALVSLLGQSLAPSMGDAGSAAIFFFLMAGQGILCLCLFTYVAHCFLAIIEQTAGGNDEIAWPDSPFIDWAGEGLVLGYLLALPVVPVGFLLRVLKLPFLPDPALRVAAGVVVAIWLLFPITVLSSMMSQSPWSFFNPKLLGRVLRRPISLLAFYLITGSLLAGTTILYVLAFSTHRVWLLPIAAFATSTLVLIYARLLGRLAWVAGRVHVAGTRTAGSRSPRKQKRRPRPTPAATDPWDPAQPEKPPAPPSIKRPHPGPTPSPSVESKRKPAPPPIEEDEWNWKGSYGVFETAVPRVEEEPSTPEKKADAIEPLSMQPLPVHDRAQQRAAKREGLPANSEFQEEYLRPRDAERPPAIPLITGVFSFPWYPLNLAVWFLVAVGFGLVGFIFHLLLALAPG